MRVRLQGVEFRSDLSRGVGRMTDQEQCKILAFGRVASRQIGFSHGTVEEVVPLANRRVAHAEGAVRHAAIAYDDRAALESSDGQRPLDDFARGGERDRGGDLHDQRLFGIPGAELQRLRCDVEGAPGAVRLDITLEPERFQYTED